MGEAVVGFGKHVRNGTFTQLTTKGPTKKTDKGNKGGQSLIAKKTATLQRLLGHGFDVALLA